MEHFFDAYGPFEIMRSEGKCAWPQNKFWEVVEAAHEMLPQAIGCYLFCLRYGNNINPYYVGMTAAITGFRREIFTDHKIGIYDEAMKTRGAPLIFFFPLLTAGERRFARASISGKKTIGMLEKMLMGFAFQRNPDLMNLRDMAFLLDTTILGVFGQKDLGRPVARQAEARAALFGQQINGN